MKTTLLYIAIICLMLIQACKQDSSSCGSSYSTNYHTLSTAAINQTPYFNNPSFDTISFASDKGDTVTFVKTKTDSTWDCESDISNADCPIEKASCYQTLHNIYKTIKGVGTFDIKHSLRNNGDYNKIEYTFSNNLFWAYDDWIGWSGFSSYKKFVNINNKNYQSVIIIYITPSDVSNSTKGYINKDLGLFYVNDKVENKSWVIISP